MGAPGSARAKAAMNFDRDVDDDAGDFILAQWRGS
jgi:hypothetical protein